MIKRALYLLRIRRKLLSYQHRYQDEA